MKACPAPHCATNSNGGKLENDSESDTHAGVDGIEEVVSVIHVVNVAIIIVRPICWPGIYKLEPISTVLEPWTVFDDDGMADMEVVLMSKVLVKVPVGNAPCLPCVGVIIVVVVVVVVIGIMIVVML